MWKIVYLSPLTVAQCLERIQAHVPDSDAWCAAGAAMERGTVLAKIRGQRVRLFALGPPWLVNSYAPFFYGRVETVAGGTQIVGRFRWAPWVTAFMAVWFGALAAMTIALLVVVLVGPSDPTSPVLFDLLAPLVMMLAGAGLMALGRWLARKQVASVHQFLRVELEATPE